jgi:hypothetical protein
MISSSFSMRVRKLLSTPTVSDGEIAQTLAAVPDVFEDPPSPVVFAI